MSDTSLPLLSVYEVENDGVRTHLICFLDPVLAGSKGIESRCTVGTFVPDENGEFDPETFQSNPDFIESLTRYMNEVAVSTFDASGGLEPGSWLEVIDPRVPHGEELGGEESGDVVGVFKVDDAGRIVPGSFQYNHDHAWFDPRFGISGILSSRPFYDWLHPLPSSPVT